MTEVKVREGLPLDTDFIIESQIRMAKETEDLDLTKESLTPGVSAVFEDRNKGVYYVAEVDGQRAGCLLTLNEWSDWRNGNILWIHSVFVDEKFRGRGVYKAMYRYLQDLVKSTGLRGLRLYVDKTNTKAQAVYSKLGMDGNHYAMFEWMK